MTTVEVIPAFSAEETAKRIRALNQQVASHLEGALDRAIECGELLNEAFTQVPAGQWSTWVEENCAMSRMSASTYRRLARYRDFVLEAGVPSVSSALRLLRENDKELPRTGNGFSRLQLDQRVLEQVRRGELSQREAGELLGCSDKTVAASLNPERTSEVRKKKRMQEKQRRNALRQFDRDQAVRDAGGGADTVYTFIRQKGHKLLEKAQREATTSDQRKHLELAQRRLYEVEDELVKAAKLA